MKSCFAFGCYNSKAKSDCREKTFFGFPINNPQRLQIWLKNIKKEGFEVSKNDVLCSDHFRENLHYTICPFTKRRKLKKDAVPDILHITPEYLSRGSLLIKTLFVTDGNNLQPEQEGRKLTTPGSAPFLFPNGAISIQEHQVKTECDEISTVEETCQSLNLNNPPFVTAVSNQSAFIQIPSNKSQVPTTVSGTESQNITGTFIKQEPVESVDELLVSKEIPQAKGIASSPSCTSSINSSIPPLLENLLLFTNPNSTNKNRTPTQYFLNKLPQKRRINDTKPSATPDAAQAEVSYKAKTFAPTKLLSLAMASPKSSACTPNATQDKSYRRTFGSIPSKDNVHASGVTPTKSSEFSTLPMYNDDSATRDMFESLLDDSESDPLQDSNRTAERPGDLFDIFADFIAVKLRGMDLDDCACSIRAIMDVVLKYDKENEVKNDIASPEKLALDPHMIDRIS